MWTDNSTGTGSVSILEGKLILESGVTSGGSGRVDGNFNHSGDFDFVVDYTLGNDVFGKPSLSKVQLATLNVTDGTSYARLSRVYDPTQFGDQLVAEISLPGISLDRIIPLTDTLGTLRILRYGSRLRFLHNGIQVWEVDWLDVDVTTDLWVDNLAANFVISTALDNFKRIPIVTYGGQPCMDIEVFSSRRLLGTFPPFLDVTREETVVDLNLRNASNLDLKIENALTYVIINNFQIQNSQGLVTDLINDTLVRNNRTSPGFTQGGSR